MESEGGIFPHCRNTESFPLCGHLRSPVSVPLQACSVCSLGKCAKARKEIKVCLAFPTGPVNHSEEDSSCHTAQEMGPSGPGNSSIP